MSATYHPDAASAFCAAFCAANRLNAQAAAVARAPHTPDADTDLATTPTQEDTP